MPKPLAFACISAVFMGLVPTFAVSIFFTSYSFLEPIFNSHYINIIKTIFCSKIKGKICFQPKNITVLIISAKIQ